MATKRRKRSHLTLKQCYYELAQFGALIDRWAETSDAGMFGEFKNGMSFYPEGSGMISVLLKVRGSFGVAEGFFEAMRVLRGAKLPRKE